MKFLDIILGLMHLSILPLLLYLAHTNGYFKIAEFLAFMFAVQLTYKMTKTKTITIIK